MATTATSNLVSSLGAGSGVDIKTLAQNLVDAEKAPQADAINTKISKSEAKISGYGALLANLSVIKTAFQGLENPSSVLKPTVQSGDASAYSATVSSNTAAASSHSIKVLQLATAQTSLSSTFSNADTPINGGAAFSLQLSVNGGSAKTIRVPAAAASPAGVVSAINGAKLGVKATLVNNGSGSNAYSIVVTGETGASKAFSLTTDNGSGTGESQKLAFSAATASGNIRVAGIDVAVAAGDSAQTVATKVKAALEADATFIQGFAGRSVTANGDGSINVNFAGSDGNMADLAFTDNGATGVTASVSTTQSFSAGSPLTDLSFTLNGDPPVDASIQLDGVTVSRASNTVSDLIPGVTLNLLGKSTNASQVTVTQDTSGVLEKVNTLIKGYNDFLNDYAILTGAPNTKDTTDQYSGSLQGNSTASRIKAQIKSLFLSASSTPSGSMKTLSDLGISFQRDGTLSLDQTKFNTVLAANPTAIGTMLTADKENKTYVGTASRGLAGDAIKKLNDMISSQGVLNVETKNANSQITKYKADLAKLDTRMTAILARYMNQFTAMDSLVGQSKSLQTSLKSQFDGMMSSLTSK